MKAHTTYAVGIIALIVAGSASLEAAEQPEIKITINDVRIEDTVYTPFYQVETEQDHEPGASARWIRLGVYFTTEGGWVDELDITQMATRARKNGAAGVVLSETVHYINLEPGDHYVYMYLHPSYVKRYEIDAFDLDSAAVIKIGDQELSWNETNKHAEKGWSKLTDEEMERGYLLNHAETPFWFINYDFKEIIKR